MASTIGRRPSSRASSLRDALDMHINSTDKDANATASSNRMSLIKSMCEPINKSTKLTEYDVKEEDWTYILDKLNSRIKSEQKTLKEEITEKYGDKKLNALMSMLMCHPTLDVVKILVEIGGENTVIEVSECGFNAIHYACWGNASLEVITYLLTIGKKEALQKKSANGANPLHIACMRYKSTESNSLSDVVRLFIEVGGLAITTATDQHHEIPLHGLLLHSKHDVDVNAIKSYFDEWYKFKIPGETLASITGRKESNEYSGVVEIFVDKNVDEQNDILHEALNKIIRQLLKTHGAARYQILKSQFTKEYLTERFIEPLPLAILITDLYIQILIVCVFWFFINPNFATTVSSTAINTILIICMIWRILREMIQGFNTTFGAYLSSLSNWFDIAQIVLIFITLQMNLDFYSSRSSYGVLTFAIFISGLELFTEIHNFQYSLAVFYAAIIKVLKKLWPFIFTTLMFVATFAHAYYIAGTDDAELCDKADMYETKDDFILAGGFTCTRLDSYKFAASNLFEFAFPSGFFYIPLLFSLVMLILFLNIIIAVVCTQFEVVQEDSEVTFWSDRLEIVSELVVFSSFTSCFPCTLGRTMPSTMSTICCKYFSPPSTSHLSKKRIDLNLYLERSVWDGISEEEQVFLHWWYGKTKDKPKLRERARFFIMNSALEDIFIPASVFENILLGYNRSHKTKGLGKICGIIPSIIFMVASNALCAIVFVSGCLTFGVVWPKTMKKHLFSVNTEKEKIIHKVTKNNEETSTSGKNIHKMMVENNVMKKEINAMRNENGDMRREVQEILAGMKSLQKDGQAEASVAPLI